MKHLFLIAGILIGLTQTASAIENEQFIGRWKLSAYKCASGKFLNLGSEDAENVKYDAVLNVLNSDRIEASITMSFSFKAAKIAELTQYHDQELAKLSAKKQTKRVAAHIAAVTKSRNEALSMLAPQSCTNLQSMTYYIRGKTLYTNDIRNLSNCNSSDGDDGRREIELEASTIVINGDTLIMTHGREVEKNSICSVGDRGEMTFVRD